MKLKILQVEDNSDDVLLLGLAFRKSGIDAELQSITDGKNAIAALANLDGSPPPACVLLDVKLPGASGFDVLQWIRSQPRFRGLPVLMFTSSLLPAEIARAYELGANSYLIKPTDLDSLIALIKTIDLYWLRTNTPAPLPA